MNQLEILRESLGQCDEIILDALLMRNRSSRTLWYIKKQITVPILQPEQEAKQKDGWNAGCRIDAIKTRWLMFLKHHKKQ